MGRVDWDSGAAVGTGRDGADTAAVDKLHRGF